MEKGDASMEKSMPEKAKSYYQNIVDEFPDDLLAIKANYKIAWIELEKNENYEIGYNILNKLAEKYSGNEIGKAAKADIDEFPRWLINKTSSLRSDSTSNAALRTVDFLIDNYTDHIILPEALYLKGNIYLNDLKEYYRAINTYQEVLYKYKGTNYESMSKFMIGFIYANVLNDLSKAERTYSEFIQEFPEHELIPSVKFELDYLGKQIKDIEELTK